MVRGISRLRLALMFSAALAAASCGRSSAAHFRVTGEGRNDWKPAAGQIWRGNLSENGCGMPDDPTPRQIKSMVDLLVPFAIEEVNNSGCGALGPAARTAKTPEDADTERCGIGASWKDYTSVAVPWGFCEAMGETSAEAGTPEAGVPKPDAESADAGVQGAAADVAAAAEAAGAAEAAEAAALVQPESGTPEAGTPDAGTPEVITPEAGGHQPEATGPSPRQQAYNSLDAAVDKAKSIVDFLNKKGAGSFANRLNTQVGVAQAVLDNQESSTQDIRSAARILNNARTDICQQVHVASIAGGGAGITCP